MSDQLSFGRGVQRTRGMMAMSESQQHEMFVAPGLNVPAAVLLISGANLPEAAGRHAWGERLVLTGSAHRAETLLRMIRHHPDRDWVVTQIEAFREVVARVGNRLAERTAGTLDLLSELASLIVGRTLRFPDVAAACFATVSGVPTWTVRVPLSLDPAANPWYAMDERGRDCFLGLLGKGLTQAAVVADVLTHGVSTNRLDPHHQPGWAPVPFDEAYRDPQRWQAEVERVTAAIKRIGADRDRDLALWASRVQAGLRGEAA